MRVLFPNGIPLKIFKSSRFIYLIDYGLPYETGIFNIWTGRGRKRDVNEDRYGIWAGKSRKQKKTRWGQLRSKAWRYGEIALSGFVLRLQAGLIKPNKLYSTYKFPVTFANFDLNICMDISFDQTNNLHSTHFGRSIMRRATDGCACFLGTFCSVPQHFSQ